MFLCIFLFPEKTTKNFIQIAEDECESTSKVQSALTKTAEQWYIL